MKYFVFFLILYSIKAQLFETLARLPTPPIFQSSLFQGENALAKPQQQPLFQQPIDPIKNTNILPQFKEIQTENDLKPTDSSIIKGLLASLVNKTSNNALEETNYEKGEVLNPLPDFIKKEIAPRPLQEESHFSEKMKEMGITIENKTIFLQPDTKISVLNSTFSMKLLEKLVSFNVRLMKKCGENLEFCMIRDNVLDEEVAGVFDESTDLSNTNLDLLQTYLPTPAKSQQNMKFLEVNNNEKSLQAELEELLSSNEANILNEDIGSEDFDVENI